MMQASFVVRAAIAALLVVAGAARAQAQAAYQGADLALGERLIAEHRCNQCHALNWTDDGKAIYRPRGRINTPAALLAMVERCSNELSLTLFPEEVEAIAAVLDRDHYHFGR